MLQLHDWNDTLRAVFPADHPFDEALVEREVLCVPELLCVGRTIDTDGDPVEFVVSLLQDYSNYFVFIRAVDMYDQMFTRRVHPSEFYATNEGIAVSMIGFDLTIPHGMLLRIDGDPDEY